MNDKTELFRNLHKGPDPLLLANVWDAGSARLVESLGSPAVATTSAGMAWALGYRDGNKMPVQKLWAVVENIVESVKVPVSVDIEDGYECDPERVGEHCKPLFQAGVAGFNIEDGRKSPLILKAKIEKIKSAAAAHGVDVFVNARTDVYLQGLVEEDKRLEETIMRGNYYLESGADGLFVPALTDETQIRAIADGVAIPLNVLAWPGLALARELGSWGVRRLSAGSGIPQILFEHAAQLAKAFFETGDSEIFSTGYMAHSSIQGLFASR